MILNIVATVILGNIDVLLLVVVFDERVPKHWHGHALVLLLLSSFILYAVWR